MGLLSGIVRAQPTALITAYYRNPSKGSIVHGIFDSSGNSVKEIKIPEKFAGTVVPGDFFPGSYSVAVIDIEDSGVIIARIMNGGKKPAASYSLGKFGREPVSIFVLETGNGDSLVYAKNGIANVIHPSSGNRFEVAVPIASSYSGGRNSDDSPAIVAYNEGGGVVTATKLSITGAPSPSIELGRASSFPVSYDSGSSSTGFILLNGGGKKSLQGRILNSDGSLITAFNFKGSGDISPYDDNQALVGNLYGEYVILDTSSVAATGSTSQIGQGTVQFRSGLRLASTPGDSSYGSGRRRGRQPNDSRYDFNFDDDYSDNSGDNGDDFYNQLGQYENGGFAPGGIDLFNQFSNNAFGALTIDAYNNLNGIHFVSSRDTKRLGGSKFEGYCDTWSNFADGAKVGRVLKNSDVHAGQTAGHLSEYYVEIELRRPTFELIWKVLNSGYGNGRPTTFRKNNYKVQSIPGNSFFVGIEYDGSKDCFVLPANIGSRVD